MSGFAGNINSTVTRYNVWFRINWGKNKTLSKEINILLDYESIHIEVLHL